MQALIDAFTGFFDTIKVIIDFVIGIFEDLLFLIQLLGNFLANLPTYFGFLPPTIVSAVVVAFSIVVIMKIIGRDG